MPEYKCVEQLRNIYKNDLDKSFYNVQFQKHIKSLIT